MKPSDFKVGDRVRIVADLGQNQTHGWSIGKTGVVTGNATFNLSYPFNIKLDNAGPLDESGLNCKAEELELLSTQSPQPLPGWWVARDVISGESPYDAALSLQSPQPQQTQQKEDNMYGIVKFNHASGASGLETKPSEAEAKQLAEQFVATKRGNLTEKQYFSVSIIDLRTGKLIGSVVDAPPAVDWAS